MNYDLKINGISPICRVETEYKASLKGRVRTRDLSQSPSDNIELLSLSKWPDYDCISGNGEDVELTISKLSTHRCSAMLFFDSEDQKHFKTIVW